MENFIPSNPTPHPSPVSYSLFLFHSSVSSVFPSVNFCFFELPFFPHFPMSHRPTTKMQRGERVRGSGIPHGEGKHDTGREQTLPLTLHNPPLSSAASYLSNVFQLSLHSAFQELPPFPDAPTCAFPSRIIYSRLSVCISQKEWWNLPDPHMTILSGHRTIFPVERPLDEVKKMKFSWCTSALFHTKSNKESDIFWGWIYKSQSTFVAVFVNTFKILLVFLSWSLCWFSHDEPHWSKCYLFDLKCVSVLIKL